MIRQNAAAVPVSALSTRHCYMLLFTIVIVSLGTFLAIMHIMNTGKTGIVIRDPTASLTPTPTPTTQTAPNNPTAVQENEPSGFNIPPTPNAYDGYGPLEVADILIPYRNVEGTKVCPVGCHGASYSVLRNNKFRCRPNTNLPDDIDLTILSNSTDPCEDMEMYANGVWVKGKSLADGSVNKPIWDTAWSRMDYENNMRQWDIARTELYRLYGDDETQRAVTACVRTYAGDPEMTKNAAAHELQILSDILSGFSGETDNDYSGLMRVFGRMNAHGVITPFLVSIERKNPIEHTSRLVFVQQSGPIGISPASLQLAAYGNHDDDMVAHLSELTQIVARLLQKHETDTAVNAAVSRIVAIESTLADAFAGTDSDDYVDYVTSPREFGTDVMTFEAYQLLVSAGIDMVEYYRGMAEGFGWDAAHTEEFLHKMTATKHWVFKPGFFRKIGQIVYTISSRDWLLYCRASILYDTMPYTPYAYSGSASRSRIMRSREAVAHNTIHRFHDHATMMAIRENVKTGDYKHKKPKSLPKKGRNNVRNLHSRRVQYALRHGKDVNTGDVAAMAIAGTRIPNQGIGRHGWLAPWHPVRKQLWRTLSRADRRKVPLQIRRPSFMGTIIIMKIVFNKCNLFMMNHEWMKHEWMKYEWMCRYDTTGGGR